jgi:hypothetical protein
MKKGTKKLRLSRETVLELDLAKTNGGLIPEDTYYCESNSCAGVLCTYSCPHTCGGVCW